MFTREAVFETGKLRPADVVPKTRMDRIVAWLLSTPSVDETPLDGLPVADTSASCNPLGSNRVVLANAKVEETLVTN
jgi:hypothetical protein